MIERYSPWIVLIAALLALAGLSVLSMKPAPAPPLDAGSASPDGGLAANLWLQRIGRSVTIERGPGVESPPARTALLLLTPQPAMTGKEATALLHWTRQGGVLVVATEGDSAGALLARLGVGVAPGEGLVHLVQPLVPAMRRLAGSAPTMFTGKLRGTVVASAGSPVLVYRTWGHGIIWLLSARSLLDNAHLGRAGNRRLLLGLIGRRAVVFDQYQPALAVSTSNWLTNSVWGIALLFALAVFILYRWLTGFRLGPALPSPEQQPRLSSEYVHSLAALLREAGRRGDVLRVYQRELERVVIERYGGVESVPRRVEVEQLLAPVDRLSEADLVRSVTAIVECEEIVRKQRV